jgi:hypothetical protein
MAKLFAVGKDCTLADTSENGMVGKKVCDSVLRKVEK